MDFLGLFFGFFGRIFLGGELAPPAAPTGGFPTKEGASIDPDG